MKIEKIKPTPQYMLRLIKKADKENIKIHYGFTRYYAYLTKNDGELTKVTVACKNRGTKWYIKQVAVHGVHSDICFVKDIECFMICGYVVGWYDEGLTRYRKWWETGKWCEAYDKYFNVYAPVMNKEYALQFPEYKYSAIDKYKYIDIFKYLRLYEQNPQAELLVKFGLSNIATSKQILYSVAKDKQFRKWLINNRTEIATNDYYISTILLAYKSGRLLKAAQKFEKFKKELIADKKYKTFRTVLKNDLERLFIYIGKNDIDVSSYYDYFKACQYIELDMTQDKNLFPHDFMRWHDIRIDEYRSVKALKDAEERKELYAQFAVVSDKYLPLQRILHDAYIVVIAKSPADLIKESDVLHHCVGHMNYDQRMIREESLIFFVRKVAEPNTPYVTVEYSLSQKKVLQCRGNRNQQPSEQVIEFVNKKWLPYANRKLKKLATAA
ncbi:MAG: hypothetical protein HFK06_01640 [Clostridia bacterium]|nr:hypothetical protein [Clostridia bacterium]